MMFSDEELEYLTTVLQVQEAISALGWNPFEYIMWDYQRDLWSPMGSYVASHTTKGFRLDTVDRDSVLAHGTFANEEFLVRHYLSTANLEPPMTADEQARMTEAGQRASVENAVFRDQYRAEIEKRLKNAKTQHD